MCYIVGMNAKIRIRGWHGAVSPALGMKMAEIATCTSVGCHYEWDFDGMLSDFAAKWDLPFLVYPFYPDPREGQAGEVLLRRKPTDPPPTSWMIFITDHSNFQAR